MCYVLQLRIANMMGAAYEDVIKLGGDNKPWQDWMRSCTDTSAFPPKKIRNVVKNFDPLSVPRVTFIY